MDQPPKENIPEENDANPKNDHTGGAASQPEDEWTHVLSDGETETIQWANSVNPPESDPEGVDPFAETRIVNPINGEEETILPVEGFQTPGEALPRKVEEVDPDATRITPTAFHPVAPSRRPTRSRPAAPAGHPGRDTSGSAGQVRTKRKAKKHNRLGCLVKGLIGLLLAIILLLLAVGTFVVFQYFSIAASLPDVANLKDRASQFETTRIYDRRGNLLYEMLDPNAGRRTFVPLDRISPYLIAATIATEDKEFYNHPGFDPFAIGRALLANYVSGEIVSGASTITQQLARTLLFSQQERFEQTMQRKTREIVLAAEITRLYSKEEILELYLNENYYGNLAYGIEAAAETYFYKTADQLTLSEGAFLAGLPQAPAVYDVFNNREATYNRFIDVLGLLVATSQEKGCIFVSNSVQPVCVEALAAAEAAISLEGYEFTRRENAMRYPHWVNYIRAQLEAEYGAQTIYRTGFQVHTTLDPDLQDYAEQVVREQVSRLAANKVGSGALVAIEPSSGEVLAMVGSADFYNEEIDGQVNMAVNPRQPGSSIKPLTYLAAFEKGWTPATLIWDVPSEFPPSGIEGDPMPAYIPENYDRKFHGPATVRVALANSYNIPAVKTLDFVRIYDDPTTPEEDGFINFARRLGIESLDRKDYGLSLTLGGGDVKLIDLTRAFSIIANNGVMVPLVGIQKIEDYLGDVVYEKENAIGDQVIRPEHAYLMSSILSDNEARKPMFGSNSVLAMPFPAAAKTGTTNDFRDNWTLGYTPELAVGVWVGNADYSPMENTTGLTGAAPIWSEFMQYAVQNITGGNYTTFYRPAGIEEKIICTVSGAEPSENCPEQRTEIFAVNQPPLKKEDDLWKNATIDTWTGLLASEACQDYVRTIPTLNISDPWAIKWILEKEQGKEWAREMGFGETIFFTPTKHCAATDPRPMILFPGLSEGQTINWNPLDIYVVARADDQFRNFRLEYGYGNDPDEWNFMMESDTAYQQPERVYIWDLSYAEEGSITLRLVMNSTEERYAEKRMHLRLAVPTVTPTITPTPEPTHTPTPEPSATSTDLPTDTPTPTETQAP